MITWEFVFLVGVVALVVLYLYNWWMEEYTGSLWAFYTVCAWGLTVAGALGSVFL